MTRVSSSTFALARPKVPSLFLASLRARCMSLLANFVHTYCGTTQRNQQDQKTEIALRANRQFMQRPCEGEEICTLSLLLRSNSITRRS